MEQSEERQKSSVLETQCLQFTCNAILGHQLTLGRPQLPQLQNEAKARCCAERLARGRCPRGTRELVGEVEMLEGEDVLSVLSSATSGKYSFLTCFL